jgi:large subunit ribosomal protein L10
MPKTRQQKEEVLKQLVEKIKSSKSAIISDNAGLKVSESQELRAKCKAEKIESMSVKKTILMKALSDSGLQGVDQLKLEGSLLIAFSDEDEVAPAKILNDFAKTHNQVQFRSGILEGSLIGVEKVTALANLPTKLELYAKLVGSINAPISGFVNVLAGNLRGLVNVLTAIKGTKNV